jgi:hypothetical protein
MRIKRGEPGAHPGQNVINQRADRPQRMILRDAIIQSHVRKHPVRSLFLAAHRKSPRRFVRGNGIIKSIQTRESFSAACYRSESMN